ncbi:GlcNAc-transferase family protein [Galactobacter valiniphilus]|nr:GlcNAc-transferase family protein [Galactobacter valiniphilus]
MEQRTILVKIASFRDHELILTMAAALQQASHPENIRFAVVNQFDEATERILDPVRADPRARILEIPWRESRGLGRARRASDEMYDGEDFTLQIDAHMRFVRGWDANLIRQWDSLGNERAVLSTYPGPYRVDAAGAVTANPAVPHAIVVQGIDQHGLPAITGGPEVAPFSRGLLVGGCFQFGAGCSTTEVPAQPEVLIGDVTVHSLRLFTHGFDVVVPAEIPLFHRYAKDKNWNGEAHTPFADFRESRGLWASFWAALEESNRVAKDILGSPQHVAHGTRRSREGFVKLLREYRFDGFELPDYVMK